jgi:hypothetical protein
LAEAADEPEMKALADEEVRALKDRVPELELADPSHGIVGAEEALKLAQEQYSFCCDIVDQGVGTIENLAGGLMASSIWYFWWD